MAKWNHRLNLTSLPVESAADEAIDRLLGEAAVAATRVATTDTLLVDLGSGGGSPAIPLKILAPWIGLVLVESKTRKAAFLRDAARQLGLERVEVANARFEDLLTRIDLHEASSIVSFRAIKANHELWQCAMAFLAPSGRVFWFRTTTQSNPPHGPRFKIESSVPLPRSGELVILRS
jgi:16S rRNA (guanine527-N7)-methyltransferase